MSELPNGWVSATLGDVASYERGIAFPSGDKQHAPGDGLIACLRTTNVQKEVDWSDLWYIPRSHVKSEAKLVQVDDILISTANSQALVGKVSRVRNLPTAATLGAFIGLLRPEPEISAPFVHYRMGSGEFQEMLRGTASQTTNIANISSTAMLALPFEVPPLNEQRRIVEKLDAVFEKSRAAKARLERLPALLDKLKRSILAAAFRGDLTKDWRAANPDVEPASVLLDRIRAERRRRWEEGLRAKGKDPKKATYEEPAPVDASGLPELPEGWAWASAESVCGEVVSGSTPASTLMTENEGEVPFIKVYNLTFDADLDFSVRPTFIPRSVHDAQLRRSRVRPGDVLMNIVGPPLGKVSIVPSQHDEWNVNQAIAAFRSTPAMRPELLASYLLSPIAGNWCSASSKATAGQHNLGVSQCRSLPIPVPPLLEQHELRRRLSAAFGLRDLVISRTKSARALTSALEQAALVKAFRGELVPQDPTDEPASVLLERIRAARAAEPQPARRRARPSPPGPLSQGERGSQKEEAGPGAAPLSLLGEGSVRSTGGEGRVAEALMSSSPLSASAIVDVTGLEAGEVKKALKALIEGGRVRASGRARGMTYAWVGD